jgi:hypothetical protein
LRRKTTRIAVTDKSVTVLILHDTVSIHPHRASNDINGPIFSGLIEMKDDVLVPRRRKKIKAAIMREM